MSSPRRPLGDITSHVKKNAYFQTAIADPTSKASQVCPGGSLESATDSPPVPGTIKVIVGADTTSQRIWYLPELLLKRHSQLVASLLESKPDKIITLGELDPRDFANFVDYMRSSIYSVNTQVPEYSAVRTHAKSCLLGAALGAQDYCNAALQKLYTLFLPCATDKWSSASKSCIRASDVAFICASTPAFSPPYYLIPAEGDSLTGLRQIFFDAIASHWTQRDIVQIGVQDKNPDTAKWEDVYHQNIDFRAALAKTLQTWDGPLRSAIFKSMDTYTRFSLKHSPPSTSRPDEHPGVAKVEDDEDHEVYVDNEDDDEEIDARLFIEWGDPGPSRPLPPVPSTRRDSGERRRRDRMDSQAADLSGLRRQNERRQSDEQAVEEREWTVLDENPMYM
ncbi:hypothetical protein J1614_005918 [Plenodomus biglobosus]|nr:hypothetical protein J1614_005918 [Plenodomus biglobosus]